MKTRIINIAVLIISLALGGYCVYVSFTVRGLWAFIPADIALVMLFFPLASILHEVGHMLFGLTAKIKVLSLRIRIFNSSSVKIVPKTDKKLRGRMIFVSFGGLAFNLLFIALGTVALFVEAVPPEISLVLPASLYLFVFNAIPLETDGGKTDGRVLQELINNEDSAKVMLAVLTVQAQVLNGKPIEEIDENLLFGVPQIREDDINFIALTELRYEYSKAKGDTPNAEKYLQRLNDLKDYLPD